MPVGSGGGGARDVRAGGAFVEAYLKDNKLVAGLAGLRRRMAAFGSAMMGIGRSAAVGGALLLAPVLGLFKSAVKRAAELDDLADSFGLTTEAISPMAHAIEVAGGTLDDFSKAMVRASDAGGDPLVVMQEWLDTLAEFENAGDAARFAIDKFGAKLGPKMAALAPDFRELMKDAPIIDTKTAKDAERAGFAWTRMMVGLRAAALPIAAALLPAFGAITKFVKQNAGVIGIIAGVGAGMIGLSIAAITIGFAFKGVAMALGLVTTALGVTAGAIGFLLSPIGLVVAAIGGIGVGVFKLTKDANPAFAEFGDLFTNLADIGKTSWSGIVAAVKAGDLELAGKIAMAGLEAAWFEMIVKLTELWGQFKDDWVDSFHEAVRQMRHAFDDWQTHFAKGMTNVADQMRTKDEDGLFVKVLKFVSPISIASDMLLEDATSAEDVAKNLDQMNKERKAAADAIAKQKMDEGRKAREADNEAARKIAAQKLADLHMAERMANNAEAMKRIEDDKKKNLQALLEVAADTSKGAFQSPNWKQSFGIGDKIAERQLKAAQEGNKKLDKIAVALLNVAVMRIK